MGSINKISFASGSTYLNILFGNIEIKDPENFILEQNHNSDARFIKVIILTINLIFKFLSIIGFLLYY